MFREKRYELKNWKGIIHTTWNPGGPGVVRIHMVPPKFYLWKLAPSMVILNGQDYVPLDEAWAILLTESVKGVNAFGEGEMSSEELEEIISDAFHRVRSVYPEVSDNRLREDLITITDTFADIACGRIPTQEIGQLSMGEYAPYMNAPFRMDLMVSAMAVNGKWHCNQKCIHCYAAGQPLSEGEELSTEEWKKIIYQCQKARIPQLTFTGGEPTMRDDLCELIKEARWFVTRLNTNGIRLTKALCKKLREAELDSVQITFYAGEKEIHNQLVGGNHYEDTLQGISNAIEAGLSVSINTPLCSLNKEYRTTLEFLYEKGIRFVTCSGLIVTGNAKEEQSMKTQLSSEELYEVLKEAVDFCYSHEMEISFTSPGWIAEEKLIELGLQVPSCGACLSNMAITPDGSVVSCQSALSKKSLGSMKTDSFQKIWNSNRCRKIRAFSAEMRQICPLKEEASQCK